MYTYIINLCISFLNHANNISLALNGQSFFLVSGELCFVLATFEKFTQFCEMKKKQKQTLFR